MKQIEVVAAVIYNERNEIFITKRKHKLFNGLWEFPGGKIEVGESHKDALKREINEELNLNIYINDYITTVHYQYPDFYLIMHAYKCEIINGNLDLSVHSETKWINLNDLENIEWVPADIEIVKKLMKES